MRPTRFRGVIGFGDQKYVERMSNYRILIGDPGPGDLRSRDGQYRPDPRRALPFQAFGEGSNPAGDAGPEITNGLGAFLFEARTTPGFGGDFFARHARFLLSFATRDRFVVAYARLPQDGQRSKATSGRNQGLAR
jgi:hypothetical protein